MTHHVVLVRDCSRAPDHLGVGRPSIYTTRRVHNMALDEFINWYKQVPRPGFTKATVSAWLAGIRRAGNKTFWNTVKGNRGGWIFHFRGSRPVSHS